MSQTKVEAPFVENNRPFRNLIINGDMQIAQRGTSQSSVANDASEGYNTLDRFGLYFFGNEGGVATVSQDTTVPSDTTYGKFSKSLKIDVTTADTSLGATGSHAIKQTIESSYIHHSGWDYTSSSSKITLQFWAQSVKAGDYHIMFRCHDASGERYYVSKYTLVANTWKHIEIVVPGDSNLVFNDDNGEGLEVRWMLSAGDDRNDATADTWFAPGSDYDQTTNTQVNFFDSTDNNFFLTGVQLEVGDAATNFEHLPRDVQLQRCQRYYYQMGPGAQYDPFMIGACNGANTCYGMVHFPVEMRGDPTLTTSGTAADYCVYAGAHAPFPCNAVPASNTIDTYAMRIYFTCTGDLVAGEASEMLTYNSSGYLGFDAEL